MSTHFLKFLKASKAALLKRATAVVSQPNDLADVTVVLGNEAADLDSIVSSVSFAWYKHILHARANTPTGHERHFVPVINIPRADFPLRTECTFAFKTSFASPPSPPLPTTNGETKNQSAPSLGEEIVSNLTFIDEVSLDAVSQNSKLRLVLTDHNILPPTLSKFNDLVEGVLDHHKDEGIYTNAQPREIVPVGSATTLVVERWEALLTRGRILDGNDDTVVDVSNKRDVLIDGHLAKLMLAPILVDTINLRTEFGRVTDRDRKMVDFLVPFITEHEKLDASSLGLAVPRFNQDAFFESLQAAKFDITHLETGDLLRKDYKEWVIGNYKLGIGSVGWHLQGADGWIEREEQQARDSETGEQGLEVLERHIREFANERELDVMVVMTAFDHSKKDGSGDRGFERELVVWFNQVLRELNTDKKILTALEGTEELQLEKMDVGDDEEVSLYCPVSLYRQKNIKLSRKQVQPILQNILSTVSVW
ncbi:hypothetical protein HK102_011950 [Quaeritorhiza haematococci]|nr:hypothetical protein HK102_011950 [Quaeritorhiza haematococci]